MPQLLHLAVPGSVRRAAHNKCAGQAQAGSLHLPADFQCAPLRSESLSQPSIIPLGKHWPRSVDREARLCRADLRHMCLPGSRKPGKKKCQALAKCQTRFTQARGSPWQQVGLYFYVFVLRWRGLTHGHTARPQAACLFAGVAELLGKAPLGCRNSETCPPTSAASAHAASSVSPTAAIAVSTVSACLVCSAGPSCMGRAIPSNSAECAALLPASSVMSPVRHRGFGRAWPTQCFAEVSAPVAEPETWHLRIKPFFKPGRRAPDAGQLLASQHRTEGSSPQHRP